MMCLIADLWGRPIGGAEGELVASDHRCIRGMCGPSGGLLKPVIVVSPGAAVSNRTPACYRAVFPGNVTMSMPLVKVVVLTFKITET